MHKIKHFPAIDGNLGWFELSPDYQEALGKRLKGDHEFDFIIVGAGYTGLSVAHRLAELNPSAKIAVVEALSVGEGTSGRNAGFIIDIPHNVDGGKPNVANDKMLYALNCFAIERLQHFQKQSGDDCQWHKAGKYMTAREDRNIAHLTAFTEQLSNIGISYQELDASETQKRLGTNYYQRSVYTDGNILVNPAALIRAVAKCLPKNVTLFEKSPVLSYDYGDKIRLETLGGSIIGNFLIKAGHVFNEQFGEFKNHVSPLYTYASLTRPLHDDELAAASLKGLEPWGVTSAHWTGTTVRFTNDKRIFIRNVLEPSIALQSNEAKLQKVYKEHRQLFAKRFPMINDVEFDYTWGGMIGITLNQNSVFQKTQSNVLQLNGCNGVGLSKGTFLGYYAAEFIDNKTSPELSFIMDHSHPSWIPPEPIRVIGVHARLKYEIHQGGEDV